MEFHALTQLEGHGFPVCGDAPAFSKHRANFPFRRELNQRLAGVEVNIHALCVGVATREHSLVELPGQHELAAILRLWLLRHGWHGKHRAQCDEAYAGEV